MRGYPGHHHHLIGDVDPSMHDCLPSSRGVYVYPLEEVEVERGLGAVGNRGGRRRRKGGRETMATRATIASRTRWLANDSKQGPTTENLTRPGAS